MSPQNSNAEKRPHAGRFKKGQSGNPGGRPKGVAEVQELAREKTPEAIKTLAAIAKAADSDSARVAACKELLDRAWGKPSQPLEHSFDGLTDEQLETRLSTIVTNLVKS